MRSLLLVNPPGPERQRLAAELRKQIDCVVLEADGPDDALNLLGMEQICLMLTNLALPQKVGFEFITQAHQLSPETTVLVGIPHEDRESAIEAVKRGAFCHVSQPFDLTEVIILVARGLSNHDLRNHQGLQSRKFKKSEGFHGIIGTSVSMRKLFDTIEKVAEENSGTVLIQGETGSGKELVARAVHALGPRKENNFVPINCGAIPDDLLESELFGYVKGAFTGANNNKIGRIQHAEGGTLFLDEIGEMKPALQVKLLRVLQERKFEPLGGVKSVSFNVRVIAATHRDLETAVAEGKFREDLYYRLSVLPLHIPPLRERKEDIPLLLNKFIQVFNRERKNVFLGFGPRALTALHDYPWPGNVRELENLVQRMAILHGGSKATLQDLPEKFVTQGSSPPPLEPAHAKTAEPHQFPGIYHLKKGLNVDFNSLIEVYEKHLILESLKVTGGNKKEAALLLSLKRTTLLEKIKKNCSIVQSSNAMHN